jgi:hypothetical protein
MARQQFRGNVRHCRRFSSADVFVASLTASDRGRGCNVDDDDATNDDPRLVVRDGGLGRVDEVVVVVVVDAVVDVSSAKGVGGESCC